MTAPDDEKVPFSNNGKHAIKPTLLIKMLRKFRQLTRDRQNKRTQKLKRVKGSFSGIERKTESLKSKKETGEKVQTLKVDIPSKVVWKAIPVLVTSLLLAALALYFISPTSKKKQIEVVGNERLTAEQVENYSVSLRMITM